MIPASLRRPPSAGCFPGQMRLVRTFLEETAVAGPRLDIGAAGRKLTPSFLAVDIQSVLGVDVIADAHALPFADGSAAAVNCNALLEHVREPFQVMGEIRRVLGPGGRAAVWVPFLAAYHHSPEDYFRYTISGARALMEGFADVQVHVGPGAFSTLCEVLRNCCALALCFGSQFAYKLLCLFFGYLFFPIKFLDLLFFSTSRNDPAHHGTAAGFLVLGVK